MAGRRSDYRLDLAHWTQHACATQATGIEVRKLLASDATALAELMLDAYRGTIDYHDEDIEDARDEIDAFLTGRYGDRPLPEFSNLAFRGDQLQSACLTSQLQRDGQPVVAFVMTLASEKRQGLSRHLLALTLQQLQAAGKVAVHAVITDGNTPSERLFRSLGFRKAADKS